MSSDLRNSNGNPFLYLEDATGSAAFGIDAATNTVNLIASDAIANLDPSSGGSSISIQSTTPGDIEFSPKGAGQSTFVNGDVEIFAGNLLMKNTAVAGTEGVIEYGGNRFVHNAGTDNTFVGSLAGNLGTTGDSNVAVGTNALNNATSMTGMTAIGFNALTNLTAGINNTAVGYFAMESATNANQNTAVGYNSLRALTSPGIGGGLNAAFGASSLISSTLGRFNTALGCQALNFLNGNGDNDIYNLAVGIQAGRSMTSGTNNTLVGAQAGVATLLGSGLLTGDNNVIVGAHAGETYTGAETSNVLISNAGVVGENLTTRLGTTQTRCFVSGISGAAVTATGTVGINAAGQLGASNGTNGQIQVGGGTGPVWANITSTGSSITVTSGVNSINLEAAGQPGLTWSIVTGTTQAAAANGAYIANNAGLVTVTLLAAASAGVGTKLAVTGVNNANGWIIAQNASQQIFFGTSTTTAGVGGSLSSNNIRDSIELVCVSADGLFWNVVSSVGNITVV